jgi:serine/threonine protein kinase
MGIFAVDTIKAIAGGSYSIVLHVNDANDNKIIVKIQEHSKMSDVDIYLKIKKLTQNICPYLIKMYGVFKSFDSYESFDDDIYYIPEHMYKKNLLNIYILFEYANGNLREITKYLSELKKNKYETWISILKTFLYQMINAIMFLHNINDKFGLLHLDLRPENIVYTRSNSTNNINFKVIDIGSVVEYKFDAQTEKERLRGSGVYSRYVYKNSPYRDYYNLWLTICEVFDLYDFKSYNYINSREKIRQLVANCHIETEILSKKRPDFLNEMFKNETNLTKNLQNLKNSINVFRKTEKLNINISQKTLANYTDFFIFA